MFEAFLVKYKDFISQHFNSITDYYSESTRIFPQDAIKALYSLFVEFLKIKTAYNIPTESLNEILIREQVYEIEIVLLKIFSINKWLRSSITTFGVGIEFKQFFTLNQSQATDAYIQQQPFDFFFTNNLLEQDYSLDGGNYIQVDSQITTNKKLQSVVDYSVEDSRKGKDIHATFSLTGVDIKTIEKDACVTQQIDNLLTIRKGDIYSAPYLGVSQETIVGTSRNLLNIPVLNRELQVLFNTDDFFTDFTLTDFKTEQDNVWVDFTLTTVDNVNIPKTLLL